MRLLLLSILLDVDEGLLHLLTIDRTRLEHSWLLEWLGLLWHLLRRLIELLRGSRHELRGLHHLRDVELLTLSVVHLCVLWGLPLRSNGCSWNVERRGLCRQCTWIHVALGASRVVYSC